MTRLTKALAVEHEDFSSHVAELRRLADDCSEERPGALIVDVEASLAFLENDLLPHAAAEDAVLYPAVARLIGCPAGTDTMRRDHEEIRRLIAELRRHHGELGSTVYPAALGEVRRLLYALHAVISLHVAKEEEVYFPLLDASLSDDEADVLLARMHDAAHPLVSEAGGATA